MFFSMSVATTRIHNRMMTNGQAQCKVVVQDSPRRVLFGSQPVVRYMTALNSRDKQQHPLPMTK
jgi:hypothetical protein